jgi:hypothetical protein
MRTAKGTDGGLNGFAFHATVAKEHPSKRDEGKCMVSG